MKKLSVVVPIKYGIDIVKVCLDTLKLYTKDYELILVNDGGDEKMTEFLRTIESDYLIENKKSLGFPGAVNKGIEKTTGEYVVVLNSDIGLFPEWADKMIAHFERDEKLGELSCTTNRVEGMQHIDYNKPGTDFQYADVVTGILMMFPKKILDKVKEKEGHYFDERFGLGGQEDSSISFDIRNLGYQVGIARDVFVYHYGSYSFREEFNHDADYSKKYAESRVRMLRNKYNNKKNMNNINEKSLEAQEQNVGIKKPLIFIAIPNLGDIKPGLVDRLLLWSKSDRYDVRVYMPTGMLPLDNARSHCVQKFMELSNNENDRLWFIDDDIIPPFEALDILYNHDKGIAGALCFMMKPDDAGQMCPVPVALRYNEEKKYTVFFEGQGLTEIDAIGGGCIMVKRKVFEDIEGRLYQFHYYPDGTLKLVGDFHFCQQAQKAGYKIYVDYGCICDHVKPTGLKTINDLMIKVQKNA